MELSPVLDHFGQPFHRDYANSTLLNPEEWFERALTGGFGETASGQSVNEASAMRVVAVFACVRNYADDVAKLPLKLYEKMKPRGRSEANEHPLFDLLSVAPNSEMSAITFWQTLVKDWARAGNGYAEIIWKGDTKYGRVPAELWPIPFEEITPKRDRNGTLYYEQSGSDGPRPIPADRMFHIRWMGDGVLGWSPIRMARESIGVAMSQDQYDGSSLKNDSTPGGILEHPAKMKDDAYNRFRKDWKSIHAGPKNRREIAILEDGMKYHPLSPPAEDMQFIERMQYRVEDIARLFRMPPHIIQYLAHATNNNIEWQGIEYVKFTLSTPLATIQQEVKRKLLPGNQNARFYAKHTVNALMQGDSQSRAMFYTQMHNIGVFEQNDVLELEDMNPIEDSHHSVNGAMVPLRIAKDGPPQWREQPEMAPDGPEDGENGTQSRVNAVLDAHRPLLQGEIERILRMEFDKTVNGFGKKKRGGHVVEFFDEEPNHVAKKITPVVRAVATSLSVTLKADIESSVIESAVSEFAHRFAKKSLNNLKNGVQPDDWNEVRACSEAVQLIDAVVCLFN